jgi:hypothetical protein
VACRMLHRSCTAGAWVVGMASLWKGWCWQVCNRFVFVCVHTELCFLVMQELFADGHWAPLEVSSRHLE